MIQSYKPNKTAIIVRNPNFDAANFGGNVPAGNPDKMTIDIFGDAGIALTRTLQGQEDYDAYQPPNDRVAELRSWDDVKLLTVKVDRLRRWWQGVRSGPEMAPTPSKSEA